MAEVTYHCPYCGAVTGVERDGYLADKCVSREPLTGWEYAAPTGDIETADGIEFVCLGDAGGGNAVGDGGANDPDPTREGCGRTFYLSFCRFEAGQPVDHRSPDIDQPRFDFDP